MDIGFPIGIFKTGAIEVSVGGTGVLVGFSVGFSVGVGETIGSGVEVEVGKFVAVGIGVSVGFGVKALHPVNAITSTKIIMMILVKDFNLFLAL